uniref:Uncharacterized protein n=1 Tax=Anguilla anguilla TaxID=7936 RepID=A0A0E9R3X8_ANGAN
MSVYGLACLCQVAIYHNCSLVLVVKFLRSARLLSKRPKRSPSNN